MAKGPTSYDQKPRVPSFKVLSLTRSELVSMLMLAHSAGQVFADGGGRQAGACDIGEAELWANDRLAKMEQIGTYDPAEASQDDPG
jgi:hypothetical protein